MLVSRGTRCILVFVRGVKAVKVATSVIPLRKVLLFLGGVGGGGVSKAARPFLGTESSVPQNGAKVGRRSAWHRTEVTQSGCFTDLVQEIPLTVLGAH